MARPKGSKNKATLDPAIAKALNEKGNPAFNLNNAEPVDMGVTSYDEPYQPEPTSVLGADVAMSAITDEDYALDRMLENMASNEPMIDDNAPAVLFKKEKDQRHLLSEYMQNYTPASTINQLNDQVFLAKQAECDSIEATEGIIRHFCKKQLPIDTGYFIYHDIKVYIPGYFEKSHKKDNQSMEQKLFGNSKPDAAVKA